MTKARSDQVRSFVVCAALAGLTLATYRAVADYPFVNWDDNSHVYENAHVTTGLTWENFVWSFGIHGPSQWHPLAWWSHQLDCQLFGLNAGWHHATNLLLHVLAALALLTALRRLTGAFWPSALVAALFALHPLSVESVAWVAERRDVLSTLFWALTMWAYAAYAQQGGLPGYLLTLVLFALGLMAKPMLVTLPCVLLLLDYWPLRRIAGWSAADRMSKPGAPLCPQQSAVWLVIEKLPLFVLAAVSAWLSYLCQQEAGGIHSLTADPLSHRLANAVLSYVLYLRNMLWPWNLSPIYPLKSSFIVWQVVVATAVLVSITAVAIWQRVRRPYLLVGWLWYLGTLVPVIGLLRMGVEVSMADRWVYVPLIGVYLAVAWGLRDLVAARPSARVAVFAVVSIVLAACTLLTHWQVGFWKDSITFFERAIAVDPDSPVTHNILGNVLSNLGRIDKAMAHYVAAVRLKPDYPEAHNNLGNVLLRFGRSDEAIKHHREALRLKPDYPDAHYNVGLAAQTIGKADEAMAHYHEALRLNPEHHEARNNLANILLGIGQTDEAIAHYLETLRLKPDYFETHFNLGLALQRLGRFDEAIAHYGAARRLKPDNPRVNNSLALILATCPDARYRNGKQAVHFAQRACDLTGRNAAGFVATLAAAYAEVGDFERAVREQSLAMSLAPEPQKAEHRARLELYQSGRPFRQEPAK